jgi:hypothetical protein
VFVWKLPSRVSGQVVVKKGLLTVNPLHVALHPLVFHAILTESRAAEAGVTSVDSINAAMNPPKTALVRSFMFLSLVR